MCVCVASGLNEAHCVLRLAQHTHSFDLASAGFSLTYNKARAKLRKPRFIRFLAALDTALSYLRVSFCGLRHHSRNLSLRSLSRKSREKEPGEGL